MSTANAGMSGGFYTLAMIGAAVYLVQQATGASAVLLAILKAIVWPAYLMYHLFAYLHVA